MQIVFIFALILATLPLSMAPAAPLCSQVLQGETKVIADEAVEASIIQMAQLKLDLDRAQARGSQEGISNHYLLGQYPKKYRELVQGLQGRLTEKEVADLIKKEIRQLQEINVSMLEKTRQQRKKQKLRQKEKFFEPTEPLSFEYELVSGSPKDAPKGLRHNSEEVYISKENAIYYFADTSFVKFNMKTRRIEAIKKNTTTGTLMKNGKTFLLFSEGHFLTYDLRSKQSSRPIEIQVSPDSELANNPLVMKLSPSDNLALLKGYKNFRSRFSVVDTAAGNEFLNQKDFPPDTVDVAFLNDQQVAVMRANKDLVIIDTISKNVVQSVNLNKITYRPSELPPSITLSNDGNILTVVHGDGFISLDARNIHRTIAELTQHNNIYTQIVKARGQPRALLVLDHSNTVRTMSMDTLKTEFTFTRSTNGWRQAHSAPMSPDGEHTLIVFVSDHPLKLNYYDHWKRLP